MRVLATLDERHTPLPLNQAPLTRGPLQACIHERQRASAGTVGAGGAPAPAPAVASDHSARAAPADARVRGARGCASHPTVHDSAAAGEASCPFLIISYTSDRSVKCQLRYAISRMGCVAQLAEPHPGALNVR